MISFDIQLDRPGFSLDVAGTFEGGITAVFGPSGAGKTTLLNCIAGSIRPDSGHVKVDGRTLYSSHEPSWIAPDRRRIGTVYQDGALFPHLDVRRNIEFGWRLIPQSSRKLAPIEIAEFLGLEKHLSRLPAELSGGERQRVAIARALAISPNLLLLDEPLASLDAARRGSILNYLKRVHAEYEIPMVYVSHSISEVAAIASKAMLLRDGRVVGFDRPTSLLLRAASSQSGTVDGQGEYQERFDNILPGVVGESTRHLTAINMACVEIFATRQNRIPGDNVVVSLGANQIILAVSEPRDISARNVIRGTVLEIWSSEGRVFLEVDTGQKLIVELTESALDDLRIEVGTDVFLVFKSSSVDIFDA
ncbi:MAG: molybdenum ABC transporter ATP-binding protein [Chloroflexi bacterium]|nr:molybdenum ABC transporter ATP-binding protein [Chloroflexota bacterium]